MKRIFTYIVITFTLMVCHAQENNSVALKIDSLELKINRLQHDYDYLYCEYQLSKINTNLQVLSNELKISTNQITINVYNDNYTDNLYMGYKMSYDSSLELYNSYQLTFRSTCSYISSIVEDLDFK